MDTRSIEWTAIESRAMRMQLCEMRDGKRQTKTSTDIALVLLTSCAVLIIGTGKVMLKAGLGPGKGQKHGCGLDS